MIAVVSVARSEVPEALEQRTFGLGVGSSLGYTASGLPPLDRYSVRLQLGRVAVDPGLGVTWSRQQDEGTDSDSRSSGSSASLDARWYAAHRDAVQLVVIGGAAAGRSESRTQTGSASTTQSSRALDAHVGVGLEWASSPRWSFGIDATEPLFWLSDAEFRGDGGPLAASAWGIGLSLVPDLDVAVHLYF